MVNIVTIYWNVQVQEFKNFKNNFIKRINVPLNILIVHPEGNINFNQNLIGIVEILCELGFYIVSDGGIAPYRCKVRAPSFINLSLLKEMLVGWKMADLVVIFGSIDINMGEVDR